MQDDLCSNLLPDCIDNHGQKPQKKTARKAARAAQRAAQTPPSFFEKLGHDMADGLVRDSLPTESLNLVDRITYAKTTTSTTITANSRTIFTEETLLVAEYGSITASDPPSEDLEEPVVPSKNVRTTFDLGDFAALSALEELISQHGRVSHMGILDSSYTFFITRDRTAALYYKVTDKIAVVGGDPLCPPNLFPHVLSEFVAFRKKSGLGIAFLGASSEFAVYARQENWVTMCFGNERVLNPMTNPVLLGQSGKSITTRNKHLLNPNKDNITVEVYTPRNGKNVTLQRQLVSVYDAWRSHRNASGITQAYITVYDPFALPDLMTYVYTKDTTGVPNGFAALRMLGANQGYHLDPCVALPSSPKGITDLLTYASMALLKIAQISYLSLGYEPLETLGEITGMPKVLAKASRRVHKRVFGGLNVGGKKGYYDKWRTDERLESKLFLIFPGNGSKTGSAGVPSLRQTRAVVHVANISLRKTLLGGGSGKRVVEVKGEEAAEEKKVDEKKIGGKNVGDTSLKKKLLGRSSGKKEEEETGEREEIVDLDLKRG